jgi:hypothetical protein
VKVAEVDEADGPVRADHDVVVVGVAVNDAVADRGEGGGDDGLVARAKIRSTMTRRAPAGM